MIRSTFNCVTCLSETLDFQEASEAAARADSLADAALVVIDLSAVFQASTAAFAALIALRSRLRQLGRDVRLRGMRSKALALYGLMRLQNVLPAV